MAKHYIVVSAVGRDRPGLVNHVTHEIRELGGNIEINYHDREPTWMHCIYM